MAKGSSSKKVARAAGIGGGRARRRQTPWSYFGIIALIVILGVAGTVASRDRRLTQINKQGDTAPVVGTVWHEGYAVYACGSFLPFISPDARKTPDPQGITTRAEGIITIAPKSKASAGKNATLGKFSSAAGMTLDAAEVKMPGGKLYTDGTKCGATAGHVYVKEFTYTGDTVGKLYNGGKGQFPKTDPRNVKLVDQALLTIAFVPGTEAGKIPPPPKSVADALSKLAAATINGTTTTTTPLPVPVTRQPTVPTPASTSPSATTPATTSSPTTSK